MWLLKSGVKSSHRGFGPGLSDDNDEGNLLLLFMLLSALAWVVFFVMACPLLLSWLSIDEIYLLFSFFLSHRR